MFLKHKQKMEKIELLKKIEKIITEPLPNEITKIVNGIYCDYNTAYRSLLSKVEQAIGNDEKLMIELNHIASYMKKDFEEEKAISEEIEQMSYSIRIERMVDKVIASIQNILKEEQMKKDKPILAPILDVEEEEAPEKQTQEQIKKATQVTVEDGKCAKEIVESMLSEINSSQKTLLVKLSIIEKRLQDKEWIQHSQKKFKEEIEMINREAKTKAIPQIEQILNGQSQIMTNQILDLYQQYQTEGKPLTEREKFANMLHVEVNPQEAIKKVEEEEKREKQRENMPNQELPGNVIE